jgi:hypothetical protein
LTLNDLLVQAGGLTVLRQKGGSCQNDISEEIDDANPNKAELFNIEITPDNNEQSKNFSLFPFDVINIRKMAVYENRRWYINGAVNYAGKYVLPARKRKFTTL